MARSSPTAAPSSGIQPIGGASMPMSRQDVDEGEHADGGGGEDVGELAALELALLLAERVEEHERHGVEREHLGEDERIERPGDAGPAVGVAAHAGDDPRRARA